jgi:hypothetical protein
MLTRALSAQTSSSPIAMLYSSLLLAASALTGLVAAQQNYTTYTECCTIDPNSVDSKLRQDWCRAQLNTCPELCGGIGKLASGGNLCDPVSLQ